MRRAEKANAAASRNRASVCFSEQARCAKRRAVHGATAASCYVMAQHSAPLYACRASLVRQQVKVAGCREATAHTSLPQLTLARETTASA